MSHRLGIRVAEGSGGGEPDAHMRIPHTERPQRAGAERLGHHATRRLDTQALGGVVGLVVGCQVRRPRLRVEGG